MRYSVLDDNIVSFWDDDDDDDDDFLFNGMA